MNSLGCLRLALALGSTTALGMVACSAGSAGSPASSDLTSIENTPVKEQTIGNCWLYGTAAWAESMHLAATTESIDLSEAYWTYWYWYEQISGSPVTAFTRDNYSYGIVEGGYWGIAAELVRRYGWMRESDFAPDATVLGKKHADALEIMNASLLSGALEDPEARKDPILVLQELNRAWGLSEPVANELVNTFGPNRNFASDPTLHGGTMVRSADDLLVLAADGQTNVTFKEIVGDHEVGTKYELGRRTGAHAWNDIAYTWANDTAGQARRTAILQNVKLSMNRRLALPVSWSTSAAENGVYKVSPDTSYPYGGHLSVLVDYEIEHVPGFGTLTIDQKVTNAEALAATLLPGATISFFRIKNSWGTSQYPGEEEAKQLGLDITTDDVGTDDTAADGGIHPAPKAKENYLPAMPGYNDITQGYFDQPNIYKSVNAHYMWSVALPPAKDFPIPKAEMDVMLPEAGVPSEGGVVDAGVSPIDGGN